MPVTRAARAQQPTQYPHLGRGDPLTDGLRALHLPLWSWNVVNGTRGTVSSSLVPVRVGRYGWHQYFTRGTGNQKTTHTVPGVTGGITFMVVGALYSVIAGSQVIGALRTSSGGTGRISIGEASNSRHTLTVTPSGGATVSVAESSGPTEDAVWIGRVDAAGGVSFFRNGVLIGTATAASANFSDVTVMEVGSTNFLNDPNCRNYGQAFWARALTDAEIGLLGDKPWRLIGQAARPAAVDSGGGGAASLVIADALHAHAADALVLTSDTALAPADAIHGHAADGLTLSTDSTLALADALHAHAAESLSLTTTVALTLQDAAHAHAADNLTLSVLGNDTLAINDAAHGHTAEACDISSSLALAIADAIHQHLADGLALSASELLTIADALHAHAAENVTLLDAPILGIADALHAIGSYSPTLTTVQWLAIADALHGHRADGVVLGGSFEEQLEALARFTLAARSRNFTVTAKPRRTRILS